jgi:8-oxo-dGTP diphosphatase
MRTFFSKGQCSALTAADEGQSTLPPSRKIMSRSYPQNPVCAVGAIIFRRDEVLLIRRGKAPALGKWSMPGGAVNLGEGLEEAVVREVEEETGLKVRPVRLGKVVDRIFRDEEGCVQYHFVIVDYLCDVLDGQPQPKSDAAAVGYFKITDLESLDMTEGTAEVIREVYRSIR